MRIYFSDNSTSTISSTTSGVATTTSGVASTTSGVATTTSGVASTTSGVATTTSGVASTTSGVASTLKLCRFYDNVAIFHFSISSTEYAKSLKREQNDRFDWCFLILETGVSQAYKNIKNTL